MKKRNILLSIAIASVSLFSLAACSNQEASPTSQTVVPSSEAPASSTSTVQKCTVNFVTNCDTEIASVEVDKGGKITQPNTLRKKDSEGRRCEFKGWYTDQDFKNAFNFDSEINDNVTLYAKWFGYEEITYTLLADKMTNGTTKNKSVSLFTVVGGEVRGRTKDWTDPNDSSNKKEWLKSIKNGTVEFTAPGNGKVVVYTQNGSSDASTQTLVITQDGMPSTTIKFSGKDAVAPYPGGSPVVAIEYAVEAGEKYNIRYGGTQDFYQIDLICTVKEADMTGIAIEEIMDEDLLVGEHFDLKNLSLNAVYGNGKIKPISSDDEVLNIDETGFDPSTSGVKKLKVTYENYDPVEFDVNVWEVESIDLGFNKTYQSTTNTSAGNGQYINGKVKKIYSINESLNTDYLSVIANAKLGTKTKKFLVNERVSFENVSYDTVDTSTAGAKTVTVNYNDGTKVTSTYNITVVDTAPVKDANNNIIANVDATYTGVQGAADTTLGNRFTTIGEALEYLGKQDNDTKKVLTIASGTYKEKLEITVPNLTINGLGSTSEDVLIEWDSLYAIPDEGGYYQITDSCQSVAVRESAINCTINNVTISNWWNSVENFASKQDLLTEYGLYTTKVNEHRAVALLVQSDKFVMNNVKLLGYQDTVQFQKGRQVLNKCYISGTTDYIFGTNNTTLFNECEIHAIYNGSTDGGYTTAFKGSSKGAEDAVTYGAVFYKCHFTADSTVATGNTALGRTWGAYAAVAFIECEMDAHVSKKASSGATKNERYVSMQGFTPGVTTTVQFVEYGNTGDGAISASQTGVTYLDSTNAAKYHNYATIFGETNRSVRYSDSWDPTALLQ